MRRKVCARPWRLRTFPSLVTMALISIVVLFGASGCSMAGVYPAPPTSAEPLQDTQTPAETGATKVVMQVATEQPTKTAAPSPTASPSPPFASPTLEPSATPTAIAEAPTTEPTVAESAAASPLPENVNPLTGLTVPDAAVLKRLPLFVRIGNDPQIRPQSGLSYADLVYEDIMDGWWITRLTGVYLSADLETVGPVRSARLVNLQMVPQYKGGLVHSGASDPIRWRLSKSTIVDLDEFFHRAPYFYKEGADWRGRLFVNLVTMRDYLKKQKLEEEVSLEGFVFDSGADGPPAGLPATEFTIPYPKNSTVRFVYDPLSGRYLRFVQGQPHRDALNNQQLSASTVVVQFCPHNKTDIVEDSQGTTSIDIVLLGEGRTLVFRDGIVIPGRWVAANPDRMTRFLDDSGRPIPFKAGQTWIELVPPDYEISTVPSGPLGATIAVTGTLSATLPALTATPAAGQSAEGYYYGDSLTVTQPLSEPAAGPTP